MTVIPAEAGIYGNLQRKERSRCVEVIHITHRRARCDLSWVPARAGMTVLLHRRTGYDGVPPQKKRPAEAGLRLRA